MMEARERYIFHVATFDIYLCPQEGSFPVRVPAAPNQPRQVPADDKIMRSNNYNQTVENTRS